MANISHAREFLGGAKVIGSPETELDFVPIIRKGFPVSVFKSLGDQAELSEETICRSLRIARRTAARRKQRGARSAVEAGRVRVVAPLGSSACRRNRHLGEPGKGAREWLLAP